MFAQLSRQATHSRTAALQAGSRLRRIAAVLAAVTCALVASARAIPAAFASTSASMPVPGPGGKYAPVYVGPVRPATVHTVISGGLAGWQVALIVLGAALVAAGLTVLLNRTGAARRLAPLRPPDARSARRGPGRPSSARPVAMPRDSNAREFRGADAPPSVRSNDLDF